MVNRDISRDAKGKYVYGSTVAGYRVIVTSVLQKIRNCWSIGTSNILVAVLYSKKFYICKNCYVTFAMIRITIGNNHIVLFLICFKYSITFSNEVSLNTLVHLYDTLEFFEILMTKILHYVNLFFFLFIFHGIKFNSVIIQSFTLTFKI